MPTRISDQSIAAIAAIAEQLLFPMTEMSEAGEDRMNGAAETASSLVIYSPDFKRMTEHDKRFAEDLRSETYPEDPISAINRLYMHHCFGLGFDLAMVITAHLATDPLGDHDLKPLIKEARERYVDMVVERRDAYARGLARTEDAA